MTLVQKKSLSTENYRGTRDFFPPEYRLRAWLFDHWKKTLKSFGYEEYDGPLLEPLDLYAAKSSEEIVREQLYQFEDRGNRRVAIRPEMTPTLARMVAQRGAGLPKPLRWFSIPACMRYERPQRGRLREFHQLNVDVLGGVEFDEDVETLLTAAQLLLDVGAKPGDFHILVNHRGLVNALLEKVLNVPSAQWGAALGLMDRWGKLSEEEFSTQALGLGLNPQGVAALVAFMQGEAESILGSLEGARAQWEELQERISVVRGVLPGVTVTYAPHIMRGFLYYTGLVFEVFDTHPANRRALMGGGRYGNLVGDFGAPPLPGIGYGMGDVGMLHFLEDHGLTPTLAKEVDVAVARFSPRDRLGPLALAAALRTHGLRVEAPLGAGKFGKQMEAAHRAGARAVVFQGEDELAQGAFVVKWLATGEQETLPVGPTSWAHIAQRLQVP